jgi:tetratricopeptide (TPR) repeat protein
LFRGDAERALLRYDAARASYQQALELFPRAQSARIALSHLARQRSDQEAALALLLPTLSASPEGRGEDDPWWDYHRGDGRHAEELLKQLRAPFQADRQP